MADDGAEVEKKNLPSKTPKPGGGGIVLALKKKPDMPSKIPKPKSVSAAFGGRCIVLALGKLKNRKQGEEGNVKKKKKAGGGGELKKRKQGEEGNVKKKKKKKRILNEKGDEGEEGSDDLPEDVKEGSDDLPEGSDDLPEDVKEGAHQLYKNPRPNPDIKTLFIDHTCPLTNGPLAPAPVNLPVVAVAKPASYTSLGAHGV
ncbi:PROTEIN putative-RELATED [Salix koriyanagi]|uniref:PROTEIN putative-RELATED n=1 Tax=Salix koriyanagi TaxID=2511006 RepID=A0A9Q0UZ35_9ROSI|nr:PROTEIN putative-RELATED [Salix koriyanagi]